MTEIKVVVFREGSKRLGEIPGKSAIRQCSLFLSWVVVTWIYLIFKNTSSSTPKICAFLCVFFFNKSLFTSVKRSQEKQNLRPNNFTSRNLAHGNN